MPIFSYLQEQKPSRVAQAAVAGLAALMLAAGPALAADKQSLRWVACNASVLSHCLDNLS